MRGGRTGRMGGGSSLLWRVPRRPAGLLGYGPRGGGGPQVEGQRFLGLVAFQLLWLWKLGQRKRGHPVRFGARSVAGAWPGAAEKELNFTAMLAQFGQGLQGLLCSQELSLCVPETLDQDITARLTWTGSETEN